MDTAQLRQKSYKELMELARDTKKRIDETRYLMYQHKVKNVNEFKKLKKDYARILTVLSELRLKKQSR